MVIPTAIDIGTIDFRHIVKNIKYIINDYTFEEVIYQLVPEYILSQNKAFVEVFAQTLVNVSPISININDYFSKKPNYRINSIINVQNNLAKEFLGDFYITYENAMFNHNLTKDLYKEVAKYEEVSGTSIVDPKFFDKVENVFTEDRFLLGRSFYSEKGTKTGLEYAYRVAWEAHVEGVFHSDYHFFFNDQWTGDCIGDECPGYPSDPGDPHPPGCPYIGENGLTIARFNIGESDSFCFPRSYFQYYVESSLIPAMWDAVVKPLAHPVGFKAHYKQMIRTEMVDYFSYEQFPLYKSDATYVVCLDPVSGDFTYELYATEDGDAYEGDIPISGSSLRQIRRGVVPQTPQYNWQNGKGGLNYDQHVFLNGQFLVFFYHQEGWADRTIEYWDDVNATDPITEYDGDHCTIYNEGLRGPFNDPGILDSITEWEIPYTNIDYMSKCIADGDCVPYEKFKKLTVDEFIIGDTIDISGTIYENIIGGGQLVNGDPNTDYISDHLSIVRIRN